MIALRFIAGFLLLAAIFALAADASRSVALGGINLTSLAGHWERLSPSSLKAAEVFVGKNAHPMIWSMGIKRALAVPATVTLLVLAALFGHFGRRRRKVDVYAN
jgi:hypothetical protein